MSTKSFFIVWFLAGAFVHFSSSLTMSLGFKSSVLSNIVIGTSYLIGVLVLIVIRKKDK